MEASLAIGAWWIFLRLQRPAQLPDSAFQYLLRLLRCLWLWRINYICKEVVVTIVYFILTQGYSPALFATRGKVYLGNFSKPFINVGDLTFVLGGSSSATPEIAFTLTCRLLIYSLDDIYYSCNLTSWGPSWRFFGILRCNLLDWFFCGHFFLFSG